jgi:hypothetical protein
MMGVETPIPLLRWIPPPPKGAPAADQLPKKENGNLPAVPRSGPEAGDSLILDFFTIFIVLK